MGKQSTRSSSRTQASKKPVTETSGNISRTAVTESSSNNSNKRKHSGGGGGSCEMFSKKKKNASSSTNSSNSYDDNMAINSPEGKIMEMFKTISEDPSDPNAPATMEGISILGDRLGIDAAEDIRILIFLWKLGVGKAAASETPTNARSSNSSNYYSGYSGSSSYSKPKPKNNSTPPPALSSNFVPGTIQPSEWKHGCLSLNVDSWESLEALIPSFDLGFLDQTEFRDFYKFCFRFNLSGTHRTLDSDIVIALLHMILDNTHRVNDERLHTFCSFLQDPEKGKPYQRITLDQWISFLDFCNEIPKNSDLLSSSNKYDESTSAWPVLIDEYVEYVQKISK